jgi:DNA-binding MarR family transcriptional regulator
MHAILFSLKRAHHAALAHCRALTKRFQLTPARFDMLSAIEQHPLQALTQTALCRILGVTAPTVSRMVRSLEELGFLHRARSVTDRRQIYVSLTELGARMFLDAEEANIDSGVVDSLVNGAFAVASFAESVFSELSVFVQFLLRGRQRLGDGASDIYPWHPED